MEFSEVFRASNGSLPSPDGSLVASVVASRLVIRSAHTLEVQRSANISPAFAASVQFMRWSPLPQSAFTPSASGLMWKRRSGIDNSVEEGTCSSRLLLADGETIQVFDMKDEKWTTTITQGFGGIKNVEFGRNQDEVVVFSEFQLKVTIWNLLASRSTEIPHPKFSTKAGFGYRPCTSHLAILTRSSTHDVISIHQNTSYRETTSFTLPTLDAQGLKWSPCGRWIAVWDSAVAGYKVLVYTADGHLYRTHEAACEGLGVKSVEWSPSGDFLTIGSYDGKLCFLNNYTFSPVISMNHTRTVRLPGVTVWQEVLTPSNSRTYSQLSQPTTLPTAPDSPPSISTMAFSSPDGQLIATKNDAMPSTVWIWSIKLLRPYAVLTHLSPIKSIQWHPNVSDMLMVQCDSPAVYLWKATWTEPRAVECRVKGWAQWVHTKDGDTGSSSGSGRSGSPGEVGGRPMMVLGDREGFTVGWVEDEIVADGAVEPWKTR